MVKILGREASRRLGDRIWSNPQRVQVNWKGDHVELRLLGVEDFSSTRSRSEWDYTVRLGDDLVKAIVDSLGEGADVVARLDQARLMLRPLLRLANAIAQYEENVSVKKDAS